MDKPKDTQLIRGTLATVVAVLWSNPLVSNQLAQVG